MATTKQSDDSESKGTANINDEPRLCSHASIAATTTVYVGSGPGEQKGVLEKPNTRVEEETCGICLEPMSLTDRGLFNATECAHEFHLECIDKWTQTLSEHPCPYRCPATEAYLSWRNAKLQHRMEVNASAREAWERFLLARLSGDAVGAEEDEEEEEEMYEESDEAGDDETDGEADEEAEEWTQVPAVVTVADLLSSLVDYFTADERDESMAERGADSADT